MGATLELVVQVSFFSLIYLSGIHTVAGWTLSQVVLLNAVSGLVATVEHFLFGANIGRIPKLVRSGDLDRILLLPVNTQLFLSLRRMSPQHLISGLINIPLMAWALAQLDVEVNVVMAVLLFAAGVIVSYSLSFIPAIMAFWVTNTFALQQIVGDLKSYQNYPMEVFGRQVRVLLMTVFPIAIIANFPTLGLISYDQPRLLLISVTVSLAFFLLTRVLFGQALRRYTSAGG